MSDHDKIIRYYQANGSGEQAARLPDYAEAVVKNRKYRVSEFLDPHGLSTTDTLAVHYPVLKNFTNGGYDITERAKIAFVHEDYLGKVDFGINALAVKWDTRYYDLSHRDILDALLALGIKREFVGDIVMGIEGCQVLVDVTKAGVVQQNLINIGAAAVSVQGLELDKLAPPVEKVKEIRSTVPSLRLDVIAAAGFGTSRTRMSEDIAGQKIKINWQDAKNNAHAIKAGDVISMRGRGRVEVCGILGQTKKGRISVLLKRYI